MPVSKRIAVVDPIMGTPGEQVITTEGHKSGMKIIPAGVRSHIYGTAGDQVKVLYRGMYYWVPRSKIKSAIEAVVAAPPSDEPKEQPKKSGKRKPKTEKKKEE